MDPGLADGATTSQSFVFTPTLAVAWVPSPSVTVTVAVYAPGLPYAWDGPWSVEEEPSPRSQLYVYVPSPPLPELLNVTVWPTSGAALSTPADAPSQPFT